MIEAIAPIAKKKIKEALKSVMSFVWHKSFACVAQSE